MNRKQISNIGILVALVLFGTIMLSSFARSKTSKIEYKTITTVESLTSTGLGRSRMLISDNSGTIDKDMQTFFSGVGINFKNISSNSELIIQTLNNLAQDGWVLENTSTGVQSSGDNVQGLFITRYLLVKEIEE